MTNEDDVLKLDEVNEYVEDRLRSLVLPSRLTPFVDWTAHDHLIFRGFLNRGLTDIEVGDDDDSDEAKLVDGSDETKLDGFTVSFIDEVATGSGGEAGTAAAARQSYSNAAESSYNTLVKYLRAQYLATRLCEKVIVSSRKIRRRDDMLSESLTRQLHLESSYEALMENYRQKVEELADTQESLERSLAQQRRTLLKMMKLEKTRQNNGDGDEPQTEEDDEESDDDSDDEVENDDDEVDDEYDSDDSDDSDDDEEEGSDENVGSDAYRATMRGVDRLSSVKRSRLRTCSRTGCNAREERRRDFWKCPEPCGLHYCGKACQIRHWKGGHSDGCMSNLD